MNETAISTKPASAKVLAGLVIFSLFFTLLLVEIVLRIIGFSYRLYPEKIEFGWPNPTIMESRYMPDDKLLWVQKDYREKLADLKVSKPEIIFMGDSCTEFGTYDEFFSARLKKGGYTPPVSIAKLGVGGWSSYQGMQQLDRDILPLKPKIVVVYFGWNDHWMGFGIEDKKIGRLRSPLFTILEHSRLVQFVVKAAITMTQGDDNSPPLRVNDEDFRENLRHIVTSAKEHGIIPLLVTAPSSHRKGKEPRYLSFRHLKDLTKLVPLHQHYADIVREVALEKQAPLCDLIKDFSVYSPEELVNKYFFKDGIHLTKEPGTGYDVLSGFLYDCMKNQGLLDKIK